MGHSVLVLSGSPLLVPGVCGAVDVARSWRAAVVETLARALKNADDVVVIAPAASTRVVDQPVANLDALGVARRWLPGTASKTGTCAVGVAASVALVLLGLTNWMGRVLVVEVASGDEHRIPALLAAIGSTPAFVVVDGNGELVAAVLTSVDADVRGKELLDAVLD